MEERSLVVKILGAYGLEPCKIWPAASGYRNQVYRVKLVNNEELAVIIYKREPAIRTVVKNANSVGEHLHAKGLPVRYPLNTQILSLNKAGTRVAGIYNYLPGQTIAWEAYTMKRLKNIGQMLARLHEALLTFEAAALSDALEQNLKLLASMEGYFCQAGVKSALKSKLDLLPPNLSKFDPILGQLKAAPEQALHLDFVRGNILFDGQEVSGILDFEKSARGPVVLDIARTLGFLLIDCKYKPQEKVVKYFLKSGYIKRGAAKPGLTHLSELIEFYLIHDFYKFLRHNPYEYLSQNEHFSRTLDYLQKNTTVFD